MRKKLFMLLALVMTVMTASAYDLTVGTNEHGTVKFKVNGSEVTSADEGQVVTVEITPATGWVVNQPSGQWYAAVAKARAHSARAASIDLLDGIELTAVEGQQNQWTFTMERANVEISCTYKKLLTNTDITIDNIANQTYTGEALTPSVVVKDGSTTLTANTDYTIAYSDNTNVGTATVTITAVGTSQKYAGQKTASFNITKAPLTVTAPTANQLTYNSQAQVLISAGSFQGAGNVSDCKMQYSLDGQTWAEALPAGTNVGTYTVYYKVLGGANHSDVASQNISATIAPAVLTDMTLSQSVFVYNQELRTAEVVKVNAGGLEVPAEAYDVADNTATDVGTYTVTVTGKGNFTGTTTTDFVINPAELTSVTLSQTSFDYDLFNPVAQTADVVEVMAGWMIVPEGQYEVDGNTAIEPGDYAVTVTGTGNYTGSVTAYFTINDQVIDADAVNTESGEGLNDVKLTLSVVDRSNKTLAIDKFTGGASAGTEDITVVVPAEINGWQVAVISQGAMDGMDNVTDIYMPDTKATITVEQNALPAAANIHTPLALLDDYALMASLKANYETDRVMTAVKPVNKYWTLSSGVDIMLPEGVKAYIAKADGKDGVNILELPATEQSVETERTVVKANNGVLVACPDDAVANVFELVAKASSERPSGMTPSTANAKSYEGNQLCPVIVEEHFEPNSWYILSNNEFHELEPTDNTMVPACKAILPRTSQSQARRLTVRNDGNGDTTGIRLAEEVYGDGSDSRWYDLQGNRIDRPAKKGVYIMNGKKVVIKE